MTETNKANAQALLDAATPGNAFEQLLDSIDSLYAYDENYNDPEQHCMDFNDATGALAFIKQAYIEQCDVVEGLRKLIDQLYVAHEAMQQREKVLVDALRAISHDTSKAMTIAREALAAVEGK